MTFIDQNLLQKENKLKEVVVSHMYISITSLVKCVFNLELYQEVNKLVTHSLQNITDNLLFSF